MVSQRKGYYRPIKNRVVKILGRKDINRMGAITTKVI